MKYEELEEDHDYVCKIVLIGESAVGKTNILSRLSRDEFRPDSTATLGVEFGTKIIVIDAKKIRIQIWDTAGQERYKAITNSYYKNAKGALVVFDITKRCSYNMINKWVQEFREVAGDETFIILVGNKIDLSNERAVISSEGDEKAEKLKLMEYIETSALLNKNISEAFYNLTASIFI